MTDPKKKDSFYTTNYISPKRMPTIEEIEQAASKMRKLVEEQRRKELLEAIGDFTECECTTCGRKPTITDEGGLRLILCPHLVASIRRRVPVAPACVPFGSIPLGALIIEEFNDGPRRF